MKKILAAPATRFSQHGVAATEFALVAIVFLSTVLGILELARIVYMYNTLADVTRSVARAAANIDFNDQGQLALARQRAIFRDSPGFLPFGAPISDQHIRIDYLYLRRQGGTISMEPIGAAGGAMPSCPGRNRHNCLASPYSSGASAGDTCIRLVRARICRIGGATCERVTYDMLVPMLALNLPLPMSTTIVSAETLGYEPGDPVCS